MLHYSIVGSELRGDRMLGNSCPDAIAVWRRSDGKGTALQAVVCQHAFTFKPLTYDAGGFDPTAGCKPKVYHTSRVHLSPLLFTSSND